MNLPSHLRSLRSLTPIFGNTPHRVRQNILREIIRQLNSEQAGLLKANAKDLAKMDPGSSVYDRTALSKTRIQGMIRDLRHLVSAPDPLGQILTRYNAPSGLRLKRITVPLGVILCIFEARPNVCLDIGALAIKSGNICILKGGKEASYSNRYLVQLFHRALKLHGLDPKIVTLIEQRELVEPLLQERDYIDVVIPRGSARLIQFVRDHSKIPVIETGAGIVHLYVSSSATVSKSIPIILNAKTQRTSVCNALDTLLVHTSVAQKLLTALGPKLKESGVLCHADPASTKFLKSSGVSLQPLTSQDLDTEWLSLTLNIKVVKSTTEAIAHVSAHTSHHTESILTNNPKEAEQYQRVIDAAAVFVNTSTRFTDAIEFGLNNEVGISTQKLHARGPFSLEGLTTYKWIGTGNYLIRK